MRLFIAIDFNELKDHLIELQNKIDPSIAKIKQVETFHLTLKFLGKIPEEKIPKIKEKLKQIKLEPFKLTLNNIGVFPNENFVRVIWIDTTPKEEVTKLQNNIENALKEFDFKKDFEFHPHITLARVKFVEDREKFTKNLKDLKPEEKTLEIKDFRLVKSTLTPKGPVYEDLEIFSAS